MKNFFSDIATLRSEQYSYNNKQKFPDLYEPINSPYTWLKARLYMEFSTFFVYLCLKLDIKANFVSFLYIFSGLLGGALLVMPNKTLNIIALLIFFFRGIFDWSDGHLARKTNSISFYGHIIDEYGGLIGSLGFSVGLGFFVFHLLNNILFVYFAFALLFFRSASILNFGFALAYKHSISINKKKDRKIKSSRIDSNFAYLKSFLDDRARSVDLISLFILIDIFSKTYFSAFFFILLFLRNLAYFIFSFSSLKKFFIE